EALRPEGEGEPRHGHKDLAVAHAHKRWLLLCSRRQLESGLGPGFPDLDDTRDSGLRHKKVEVAIPAMEKLVLSQDVQGTCGKGNNRGQLQKMVHDIKNNEGGIMNKIKKLKVKAPPNVPQRDYASESPADQEEQWSDDFDSDYENPDEHSDSEMYVLPAEETGDDSYEPPPVEQETRTVHPALPFTRGEYVDNRSSQRQSPPFSKTLPSKPSWPSAKTRLASTLPASTLPASNLPALTSLQKPQVPPKPKELLEDEADYVVPVEADDENYIHPTDSTSVPNLETDLCVVCAGRNSGAWDAKSPSSPAVPCPLPRTGKKPAMPLKTLPLNRIHQVFVKTCSWKKPGQIWLTLLSVGMGTDIPILMRLFLMQKNLYLPNVTEALVTGKKLRSHQGFLLLRNKSIKNPSLCPGGHDEQDEVVGRLGLRDFQKGEAQLWMFHYLGFLLIPVCQNSSQKTQVLLKGHLMPNLPSISQEADVHCKPWYAGDCDRKSAEEALYRSNKDGSFLIRKSSGHDSKQPYTLVVFFNKRVYNVPVRFIEATKQYALGRKKNGEEYFGSVAEIIKNHQHSPLVLIDSQNNTKDSTRLKYAVKVS
ncbi:B-cell linker protein, partial [Galemys pyrenaicus]